MAFSTPLVLLRAYMSPEDKEKYSNAVPQSFDEIMCGVENRPTLNAIKCLNHL